MATSRFSSWLIGADSLLAECGDILLRGGHEVHGVVTPTRRIADWARSRSLRAIGTGDDFGAELALRPFDHLFAITHLSILPDEIVSLPTRGAVNFHDGPLPDYAGLNAPAWALMQGESRYGITWHMLTSEVDAGDILKQRLFDIAPDETSLSLNTKCFGAAIDSFAELVEELAARTVQPLPQDVRRRRQFGRHRRPPFACAIDWNRPAREIEAMVRALDFGRYPNRLGLPKLQREGQVLVVTRAHAREGEAAAPPGTVLAVDENAVLIATGRGCLAAVGFADLRGHALTPAEASRQLGLVPGVALDPLTSASAERLTELDQRMSRDEGFWVNRLSELDPITVPLALTAPSQNGSAHPTAIELPVPKGLTERFAGATLSTVITAVFSAYLARLARRRTFDLGYRDEALRRDADGLEAWIVSRLPLRVEVDAHEDLGTLVGRIVAKLDDVRRRSPWLRDAIARYPTLRGLREDREGNLLPVAVECCDRFEKPALPAGAEWTIEVSDALQACRCVFDGDRISTAQAESIVRGLSALLVSAVSRPDLPIAEHAVICDEERKRQIEEWNQTALAYPRDVCVHESFEQQARRTPDAVAIVCDGHSVGYAELDARADLLAAELARLGVLPGHLVGICVDRSIDLGVSILGVLKAGGAYVPLDPTFPAERLAFMVEDARLQVIVTQEHLANLFPAPDAKIVRLDVEWARIAARRHGRVTARAGPTDLAYVIYTSGSTGRPKGVLVEHRNVANFFAAIDERIPHDPPGVWLAVTSLSFDISVLELLWTLSRGFKVVLHSGRERSRARASQVSPGSRDIDFSLFYFSSDEGEDRGAGYRLLLEGARFADANGFRAVWTPERHFHAFGGLYPNPAVTGAAIAAITQNLEIRAGSVVLPLHHPIRVAEEWSLVDNLSNGRVAISFASGWQPNDFVLAPQNHASAKEVMFRDIDVVRRLWRGEAVAFPGPDGTPVEVRTLPRPVQRELPVWITSAGNVDTFAAAGRIGANVLTHLLGQSVEQLAPKIATYRAARAQAGFDPSTGIVSLMLHTFVGEDEERVREEVRQPLESYLGSSLSLLAEHAWTFPAFRRPRGSAAINGDDLAGIDSEERAALLAHARERYYETQGLFGTPERCLAMVERVRGIGVDEIACLIDFGVPAADVLASLPLLDRVRQRARKPAATVSAPDFSIAALIRREGVTHLQCTPSMAQMLCADPETRSAMRGVKHMLVGGEAFPSDLAATLASTVGGTVTNMYGPTETTIWSSMHAVDGAVASATVPIGRPIANTRFYVLDEGLQPVPIGVAAELFIGGDGVTRGYLNRPELDAERFLPDRFAASSGARMYRTGDLVRYRADGVVEFLGRTDHQIKIRGHRIEPGEIEALLSREPSVGESVVIAREDTPGDQRLVAYVVPQGSAPNSANLRDRLRAQLPDYMVPAHFVFLEAIPRTPNKKIDRRALPQPKDASSAATNGVLPTSDLESRLAHLWQETLGVDRVGVDDNFFDIGGQSLLVVRIFRRMGELTTRPLSLTDLFRFPTIRSLARFLTSDQPEGAVQDASSRGRQRRSMSRRRQKAGEA